MNPTEMTLEQLTGADVAMTAAHLATRNLSISDEHRAVKAELGRRSGELRRAAVRSRAAKKGAVTRANRKAAGLPPKRQAFTMNNAPAGGWTDADRV